MTDSPTSEVEVEYAPSDVIAVLDQLQDVVSSARTLPMSSSVLVNQAEMLELLQAARDSLPADLVAADGIVADATAVLDRADEEADIILAQAQDEAQELTENAKAQAEAVREQAKAAAAATTSTALAQAEAAVVNAKSEAEQIVGAAQVEAERLISSENVIAQAKERANETVRSADEQARQLSQGANRYCDSKLNELEELLSRIGKQTRAGREALASRTEPSSSGPKFKPLRNASVD